MRSILLVTLALSACDNQPESTVSQPAAGGANQQTLPPGHPPMPGATNARATAPAGHTGKVAETMDSGGYTYVRLTTDGGDVWLAGPLTPLKVGEVITTPQGSAMTGFSSPTLGRTFDTLYMVESFSGADVATAPAGSTIEGTDLPHPSAAAAGLTAEVQPLEGGQTVEQVFAGKSELAGKSVALRGQVVKFNAQIMGKNWAHIQDGTGSAEAGTNDITVTTSATVQVGQVVVVRGTLATDKDFGMGYHYSAIVEDATLE